MRRTSLLNPLRTFICPRPAIQAWRSARCFATEVSPASPSTTTAQIPAFTTANTSASGHSSSIIGQSGVLSGSHASESSSVRKGPVGVVVSAGKMQKTVKVRIPGQKYNKHLRKYFREDTNHLVHDPNSSLNIGDVVSLSPHRASKHVHHIVQEILVPFGTPIADRPAVPTEEERKAEYESKRAVKVERRTLRRAAAQGSERAIEQLKTMGLDPGHGAVAGVGEKNVKKQQMGNKGHKLPEGVLPGGLHAVGKIGDRAKSNKEKTMKRQEKAEENILEARS
ncbi:hypothetical protein AAFC00_001222 [Neodothiora populina]|uniref:Nucleic acid-binding protein n=1 Tax=Neodothiora populina TaxID=2781224 RepID=A0ABR3PP74_9PEZI